MMATAMKVEEWYEGMGQHEDDAAILLRGAIESCRPRRRPVRRSGGVR